MGCDWRTWAAALAAGCGGTEALGPGPRGAGPTWEDVGPLLAARCGACHGPDRVAADLRLTEYPVARAWAPRIAEVTASGEMPPFLTTETAECPQPWGFAVDPRLSVAELDLLDRWAEAGAPRGRSHGGTTPVLPELPTLDRRDAELLPRTPIEVPPASEVTDLYRCLVLDPELVSTVWMTGFELLVEQAELVHHANLGLVPRATAETLDARDGSSDGQFPCDGLHAVPQSTLVGTWLPGSGATVLPEGAGIALPEPQVLVVSIHYQGAREARRDATGVALQWSLDPTPIRAGVQVRGNCDGARCGLAPGESDPEEGPRFLIPAGARDHTETMRIPWKAELAAGGTLVALSPHMHVQGARFRAWIERPDGSPGPCLVDIPRWDFDWQLAYALGDGAPLPVAEAGGALVLECTYDNSLDNPALVDTLAQLGLDEPRPTRVGPGALDEMCTLGMVYLTPGD